jgi:hypothetical protein
LHDALAAETQGLPAVAIMTEPFEASARAVAALSGVPDYPFVLIGHPVANDSDPALHAKAEAAVPRLVALLTGRG